MQIIKSFVCGGWHEGKGTPIAVFNPATEEKIGEIRAGDTDMKAVLAYARSRGVPALSSMTFGERGELLKAVAVALHAKRDELLDLSIRCAGTPRGDAKFDVDGAIGTLTAYASWGIALGSRRWLLDGEIETLGRSPRFSGRHVLMPRRGVAVHINAFNFPAWNMMEKAACALLAGAPVIEKPGTPTAMLAARICEIIVEAGCLPDGAWQFIVGPTGDLLDHLDEQDSLAFTGSSGTAAILRGHPNLVRRNVRVNMEADSLNTAILFPDVDPESPTFAMYVSNVALDITQKSGQKCTAVRRIVVPSDRVGVVRERLVAALSEVKVGDPSDSAVRVGPLASASQLADVRAGIARLAASCETAVGGAAPVAPTGYFVAPTLFVAPSPETSVVHEHEVFGPVATIVPFDGSVAEASRIVALGKGALVTSIYTNDAAVALAATAEIAPWTGRVWIGSDRMAEQQLPPGMVLPASIHGGPGRAGGGEELGGLRGLAFHLQRTAVQGFKGVLEGFAPDAPAS